MTSPSHKKHQIIASVLRRKTQPDNQLGRLALPSRLLWFGSVKLALPAILGSLTLAATFFAADIAAAQQQTPGKFARPQQYAPPVHAAPSNNPQRGIQYARPIPTRQNQAAAQRQVQRGQAPVQRRQPTRYTVRQVAAQQEINQRTAQAPNGRNDDPQWRTRDQTTRPPVQAQQELRSVVRQPPKSSMPQLVHPSPQIPTTNQSGNSFRNDPAPSFNGTRGPDTTLGNQIPAPNRFEMQRSSTPQSNTIQAPNNSNRQQIQNSIRNQAPEQVEEFNDGPELTYEPTENTPSNSFEQPYSTNQQNQSQGNQRQTLEAYSPNVSQSNSLRDLQIEPRRMRDTRATVNNRRSRANVIPSGYRANRVRSYQEEDDYLDEEDDEEDEGKGQKSCDEYRAELLNSPITDIVLDISPYQAQHSNRDIPYGLTRTWTDCNGNALGTGTLVRLERSYIIITNESGAEQRIARTRLSDGDLAVMTEFWGLPTECTLGCYAYEGRHWRQKSVLWKASSLCHKPLYFENRQLERYGHTHGPIMQPLHSTAHFFTSLVLWPYNSAINPPNECQYALGYYRPGDCAPWLKDPFPISLHGFARQGAFVGGAVGIFP